MSVLLCMWIVSRHVACAVGIPDADVHASLLPEDKQRLLLDLSHREAPTANLETSFLPRQRRGLRTAGFVGDGLNDCPALASAHVGVVLQEVGSQATVDAASAVLQAEIGHLPAAIVIARRSAALIMVNLFLRLTNSWR